MLVVTGGIACGKSVFVRVCEGFGLKVIDADDWFHKTYRGSEEYLLAIKEFDGRALSQCAFIHKHWKTFETQVASDFCKFVGDEYEIVVIPEYFKYSEIYNSLLPRHKTVTIERNDNLTFAITRDMHRGSELTKLIFNNQTPHNVRIESADYVLSNQGTIKEFQKECKEWLKLHLQEVLILRMRGIDML